MYKTGVYSEDGRPQLHRNAWTPQIKGLCRTSTAYIPGFSQHRQVTGMSRCTGGFKISIYFSENSHIPPQQTSEDLHRPSRLSSALRWEENPRAGGTHCLGSSDLTALCSSPPSARTARGTALAAAWSLPGDRQLYIHQHISCFAPFLEGASQQSKKANWLDIV